ncbi:MAG: hypothetical protein KGS73_16330 [Chloroflexi bacterium]|nr:hypothetical protein [Chloroflexota bacterium]
MRTQRKSVWGRRGWVGLLTALMSLALAGALYAGEYVEEEIYRLAAGQVIAGDLYVTASEIYIDGTVEGDLVGAGGYIEVNGEVTQDVIVAGGGVVVNGQVGDDLRAAGGGITVAGQVVGDVLVAGGGVWFPGAPSWSIPVDGRSIEQGVRLLESAQIGGDVSLVGGTGEVAGRIGGNLQVGMGQLTLAATVGGDATVYANELSVSEAAQIAGAFNYRTDRATEIPAEVAPTVTLLPPEEVAPVEPPPTPGEQWMGWGLQLVRMLVGFVIFGWLLLRLAPAWSERVVAQMGGRPWGMAGVALLAVVAFVPLTLLAVVVSALFWGFFPGGMAVGLFLFGLWGVLWFGSPLLTGYCLGRTVLAGRPALLQLWVGAAAIVVVAEAAGWIPLVGGLLGWLLRVGSFGYAVAAILSDRPGSVRTPAAYG